MEGLAAFVSRFEKEKPEVQSTRIEPTADKSHRENMPSNSSASNSLPFSIEEILSDKRRLNPVNEPQLQRRNEGHDLDNERNDYTFRGKKAVTFRRELSVYKKAIFPLATGGFK